MHRLTDLPARTRTPFRVVAVTTAMAATLAACGSDGGTTSPETTSPPSVSQSDGTQALGVRVVSPADGAALLAATPTPTLIDVRTPQEFAEGHLDGAILIDINAPDFADRLAELPRDESYVIYCRSGNRSAAARDVMAQLEFTDVADIEGGILAWTQAGLPVTTA